MRGPEPYFASGKHRENGSRAAPSPTEAPEAENRRPAPSSSDAAAAPVPKALSPTPVSLPPSKFASEGRAAANALQLASLLLERPPIGSSVA